MAGRAIVLAAVTLLSVASSGAPAADQAVLGRQLQVKNSRAWAPAAWERAREGCWSGASPGQGVPQ